MRIMILEKYKIIKLLLIIAVLGGCHEEPSKGPEQQGPKGPSLPPNQQGPNEENPATSLSIDEVKALGFAIPPNQNIGGALPPQPGTNVLGKIVKGGAGSDTNWTAFTLVIHAEDATAKKYFVLTQMRAINPLGTIETAGGHLVGGQTWREGARDELEQETGVKADKSNLVFLQGGVPRISKSSGELYGNAILCSIQKAP